MLARRDSSAAIETLVHYNLCTLLEGMQNGIAGMGNNLAFPQKAKQELPYDSAIPLPAGHPKDGKQRLRALYTSAHSNATHSDRERETTGAHQQLSG